MQITHQGYPYRIALSGKETLKCILTNIAKLVAAIDPGQ